MSTFVICHGAWSAGWAWKKVRPLLQAAGHEIHTPTYTGLGDRAHHSQASIGLDTHIEDTAAFIEYEDLTNVILVGHSYGGMVATGVAERMPSRLAKLVYLDAFVPRNGESVNQLVGEKSAASRAVAATVGDGWLIPPNPSPADTSAEDLAWIAPRRRWQPARTFSQPVFLKHDNPGLPRSYIYCTRRGEVDRFGPFAERAKTETGWTYYEIDASHSPNVTAPEALVDLLCDIAGR